MPRKRFQCYCVRLAVISTEFQANCTLKSILNGSTALVCVTNVTSLVTRIPQDYKYVRIYTQYTRNMSLNPAGRPGKYNGTTV